MIIVELTGGLGNQLFQYATGKGLSLDKNVPLLLDLGWFDSQVKRKYQLDLLNISANIAHNYEVEKIKNNKSNNVIESIERKSGIKIPWITRSVFIEKNSGYFDKDLFSCPKNCYISGYWQCEKYFMHIKDVLQKEFSLIQDFSDKTRSISIQMQSDTNSVSVHVRRGDYVNEGVGHYVNTMDYYQRAINFLQDHSVKPKLYVSSDDLSWTRENLYFYPDVTFIDSDICRNDVEELLLMTYCHHHINANSSFSWWGAWLNEQPDSIVTVPNKWFTDRPFPKDRIPSRWIRI